MSASSTSDGSGRRCSTSEFAKPSLVAGPSRISRYERERTVTISAFTQPGRLAGEVTRAVAAKLAPLTLPPGYSIMYGGEAEAQSRSFGGFGPAIIIAMFGILAVLLLEFASCSRCGRRLRYSVRHHGRPDRVVHRQGVALHLDHRLHRAHRHRDQNSIPLRSSPTRSASAERPCEKPSRRPVKCASCRFCSPP